MEPLPKERSDVSGDRCSLKCAARLNGAAPEGAERHERAVALGLQPAASMEPLPKERSDAPARVTDGLSATASMEPLPKERSDAVVDADLPAALRRLNGAAPEGAERRHRCAMLVADADVASMEPLPKERSDVTPRCRSRRLRATPQWSRSRRSGATVDRARRPVLDHACLNGAAPEGAERRRRDAAGRARRHQASMEPLPKERSDDSSTQRARPAADRASMEPLPKERSDGDGLRGLRGADARLNGAAPEGAERRVGTLSTRSRQQEPQWSRSRRSGATPSVTAWLADAACASMEPLPKERSDARAPYRGHGQRRPQWSRSRRSGATRRCNSCAQGFRDRPQWSRSRRSGATPAQIRHHDAQP